MKTQISTNQYYHSHASRPRGRGLWMFEGHMGAWSGVHGSQATFQFNGTYTEAKAAALVWAKAQGFPTLIVCP